MARGDTFVRELRLGGRGIRGLTVVDTHSRYAPATDPRFTYRGEDVVQTLERVCWEIGYPKTIRVDNGSEFISGDLDLWAYQRDAILGFSRPGEPTDNAYIESFNGTFRILDVARQKMEGWCRDYNEVRPHSAIGNKPPILLMNGSGASGPPRVSRRGNSPALRSKIREHLNETLDSPLSWREQGSQVTVHSR